VCENSPGSGTRRAGEDILQVVERSAIVAYTPAQMFDLVNDVARYPQFLPWCVGARVEVLSESEILAAVKVARGLVRMEFTTRNTVQKDEQILMQLIEGPFRHMSGHWRFTAIGDRGSRVEFRVEFEFKNRLLARAFNSVFEALCSTIVDAFVVRAQQIYPKP
jgi:ribosome-associated toxin RatA of RatAB toxin-antitoxin module